MKTVPELTKPQIQALRETYTAGPMHYAHNVATYPLRGGMHRGTRKVLERLGLAGQQLHP